MAQHNWAAFRDILAEGNVRAFFDLGNAPDSAAPIEYHRSRLAKFSEYGFLPFALLILPTYTLVANSTLRLTIGVTATAALIFTMVPPVKFLIGALVGSWHIFRIDSFLAFLLFLITADTILNVPSFVRRVRLRPARFKQRIAKIDRHNFVTGCAFVGLWLASAYLIAGKRLFASKSEAMYFVSAAAGGGIWAIAQRLLAALALITAVYRLTRHGRRGEWLYEDAHAEHLPASQQTPKRRAVEFAGTAGLAGVLFLLPALIVSWNTAKAARTATDSYAIGSAWCTALDPLAAYECLNERGYFSILTAYVGPRAPYPRELLQFLREKLPSGRVILAGDSVPILVTTPHYSPVVTYDGLLLPRVSNEVIRDEYVFAMPYAKMGDRDEPRLRLGEFMSSEPGQALLQQLIDRFDVDIVVSAPSDTWKVRDALNYRTDLVKRLHVLYDRDDYIVMAVEGTTPSQGQ